MKSVSNLRLRLRLRRAPQGARGLKFEDMPEDERIDTVAPRKGRVG